MKRGAKINVHVSLEVPSPLNKNDVPSRTRTPVPSHNKYSPECQTTFDRDHTITMPYLVTTGPDSSYRPMPTVDEASTPYSHRQSDWHDDLEPAIGWHKEAPLSSSGIDRLWTGRWDPFIRYPVELNHRTRELLDLGEHKRSAASYSLLTTIFSIWRPLCQYRGIQRCMPSRCFAGPSCFSSSAVERFTEYHISLCREQHPRDQ